MVVSIGSVYPTEVNSQFAGQRTSWDFADKLKNPAPLDFFSGHRWMNGSKFYPKADALNLITVWRISVFFQAIN